jgi:hypothetical protein
MQKRSAQGFASRFWKFSCTESGNIPFWRSLRAVFNAKILRVLQKAKR